MYIDYTNVSNLTISIIYPTYHYIDYLLMYMYYIDYTNASTIPRLIEGFPVPIQPHFRQPEMDARLTPGVAQRTDGGLIW